MGKGPPLPEGDPAAAWTLTRMWVRVPWFSLLVANKVGLLDDGLLEEVVVKIWERLLKHT